jgi:superfamily I DNA/RNA helicase
MAKMYPCPIASDVASDAEKRLYVLLADLLSEDYHVFHSVAWQSRDAIRGAQDGEADFVIAHPQKGILVLEVKGGFIDYDGENGVWMQSGHLMRKDPFSQAKSFKYELLRLLKTDSYWANRHILISHAVAFPDVVVPNYPLTLQAPRRLILDKRDIHTIREWLVEHFDYMAGQQGYDHIGAHGIRYLQNLLAPVRHLRSLLGVDIEAQEADFVRLTAQQCRLIDFIAAVPRAAIAGCAGSGKTMLAAYKAQQLAGEGLRVLLTCFNKNLAAFLRDDYLAERPSSLHIAHFHKVALDLVRQSGQPIEKQSEENLDAFFASRLPEQLSTAVDRLGPQYDAIVVDEAQDFLENWWLPLQLLLEEPDEGILYLFYDDNQNIYGGMQCVRNLVHNEYPLRENCRNTQKINQRVNQFYRGSQSLRALGPPGRDVAVVTYNTQREMLDALRRILHELVVEEEVSVEDIVILTPVTESKSALTRHSRLGRFTVTTDWDVGPNEVFYTTIHSFKGLESPIVILTELEQTLHHNLNELMYIACSRARHHLEIITHEDVDRFEITGS